MGWIDAEAVGVGAAEAEDPSHRADVGPDVVGFDQGVVMGRHAKCDEVIDFWVAKYEAECEMVAVLEAALRNRNDVIDELRAEVRRLGGQAL